MISVSVCKVSQPSRYKPKSYDGKFVTAKCSSINYGATLKKFVRVISEIYKKALKVQILYEVALTQVVRKRVSF